ncbi:MAG: tetratricopeptide repeat protein, partial [Desulfuromonadales bacterium]|nr:tetratricopeptide repeat protein [Desulfuromonadales bacterium]
EEYSGAIEKFELSLEIDGNSALPWHGLGNVYSDQEEYQQAEQAYRKAIELDKSFSYPWNGLGIIYRIRKDYDLSKDAYLKAIKIDETYADVHRNLGLCLWVSGNLEEALRYFETALSLYKDQGDDYRASIAEENLNSVQGEIEGKKALQAAKAQKRKNAKTPSIAY